MGRALGSVLGASIASAAAPSVVAACPRCAVGESARAAFLADPELSTHALALGAPFLVTLLLALAVHRLGAPARPAVEGDKPCDPP